MTVAVYDYHERVIEDRFLVLLKDHLAPVLKPKPTQVIGYLDASQTPPFIEVVPSGDVSLRANGNVADYQSYGEIVRYVLGTVTEGYDGLLLRSLRKWMPTVINFATTYRMLNFGNPGDTTRSVPAYFDHLEFLGGNATNPAESQGQVGLDLRFNFVYSVHIKPAPGNA